MAIEIHELQTERETLKTDFDTLSGRIKQVETDLITMKTCLSAASKIMWAHKNSEFHYVSFNPL